MPAGTGEPAATAVGVLPVDACTGEATLTRLDEPWPPVPAALGAGMPAWGRVGPDELVSPVAVTGASTLASVPVACGLELRPTITAAGACRSPLDEPSPRVLFTGARTVTSGRANGRAPALPAPWLPVVPWPAVTVAGTVVPVDVVDVVVVDAAVLPVDVPGVPEVPVATGALIQTSGPTEPWNPWVPLPDVTDLLPVVPVTDPLPVAAVDPLAPAEAWVAAGVLGAAVTPLVWQADVWAACALSGPPARKSAASAAPVPATAAAAACV